MKQQSNNTLIHTDKLKLQWYNDTLIQWYSETDTMI